METKLEKYGEMLPFVEKTAKDIANAIVDERMKDSPFKVGEVQDHRHNGSDSSRIDFFDLNSAINYRGISTVTLTTTEVKALNTTPITLVPAYGLTSLIIVEGIDAYIKYNGTAYTGANALEFRYTDGSGAKVTADISTTFLNSAASAYSHVAGVTTELVPVLNKPIVVRVPTANPGTGNSQITFQVTYRIISFV